MNEIIQIKSDKNNLYEINISEKSLLYIIVSSIGKGSMKKYKKIFSLEDLKKLNKNNTYFQKFQSISELIKVIIDNKNNIILKERNNEIELIITLSSPFN